MAWNIGTASRVEVTMVCDSTIDTLYMDPPGVTVKRLGLGHAFDPAKGLTNMPVADNCSCMLVRIYALETNMIGAPVPYTILFDCGGTPDSFVKNMEALEVDPLSINQVVISHGHPDHMGALKTFMEMRNGVPCPVLIHPDTFTARYVISPVGFLFPHITGGLPSREECEAVGARFVEVTEPMKVGPGAMTTGEIPWYPDVTFEPSPITIYHEKAGKMELDKTTDEMAICINLRGHGLVVLSGCAHNGIINTVKRCQEVSGINEVYAVIGGFHLGFPEVPRDMTGKTIEKLKEIAPKVIIPQHCTGFRASAEIMNAFPEEYVQTSAGMTVCMPFVKHASPEVLKAALEAKKQEMMTEAGYQKQGE